MKFFYYIFHSKNLNKIKKIKKEELISTMFNEFRLFYINNIIVLVIMK